MKYEIVPNEKAAALRKSFIQQFIDTTSGHYQKYIAAFVQYADGLYYEGYLWDCLKDNKNWERECRMEDAADFLRDQKSVFVMWDSFSKERTSSYKLRSLGHHKDTNLKVLGDDLAQIVVEEWNREQAAWEAGYQCQGLWLPHDIYCFDESMKWYAVFTHEGLDNWTNPELDEDAYIRVCFLNAQM